VLHPRRALLPVAGLAAVSALTVGAVGVAHALSPDKDSVHSTGSAGVMTAAHSSGTVSVAPLRKLTPPAAVANLNRSATPKQLRKLARIDGIWRVTAVDTGRVNLRGRYLHVVGVNPGRTRSFTPVMTAKSDALWQSIARGELTVGYAASRPLRHGLGQTLLVKGRKHHLATMRVGAFASIGLGAAQGVVSHAAARQLHLHPARRLFISSAHLPVSSIAIDVRRIFGSHTVVRDARPHVTQQVISAFAQATIPAPYLSLYRAAATTCAGLPWTVLAGIGAVETGHGANVHRSVKGAVGPMQFLPSTFAEYGVDGDGDGVADIHDPADAIYSAARYLCLWGAGRGGQALYDAIWAYNHADWYVRLVIQYANAYA
jgi:hypothetical protein